MAEATPSIILISGQAGAGHSTALKILEDEGYVSVDNMPLALVDQLVAIEVETEGHDLAFCVDARTSGFDITALNRLIQNMRQKFGAAFQVVHLSASQLEILRRFQSTRRHHPFAKDHMLEEAIALDEARMAEIMPQADVRIDSTKLSPNALRRALLSGLGMRQEQSAKVQIISFSYKQGVPEGADYVFDMRFLRNPHWSPDLRAKTGEDAGVRAFIAADEYFDQFFVNLIGMSAPILASCMRDGRPQVTFAFGCTGGKHRSVASAIAFENWVKAEGHEAMLMHREL